jgi:threonine/homoserine/homoserine lactone efflux protein
MNDDISAAVKVLATLGGAAVLIWLGIVMVKAAKRGGGGMNMRDLSNNPVAEAQDDRIRKSEHSGDPLDKNEPR